MALLEAWGSMGAQLCVIEPLPLFFTLVEEVVTVVVLFIHFVGLWDYVGWVDTILTSFIIPFACTSSSSTYVSTKEVSWALPFAN